MPALPGQSLRTWSWGAPAGRRGNQALPAKKAQASPPKPPRESGAAAPGDARRDALQRCSPAGSPPQLVFVQVVDGQHLPPLGQNLLLLLPLGLSLPTFTLCLERVRSGGGAEKPCPPCTPRPGRETGLPAARLLLTSLLHTQASNTQPPRLPAQHLALPRLPKGEGKDLRTRTYLGLHSRTAGEEPQRKTGEATDRGRDRKSGDTKERRQLPWGARCWTRVRAGGRADCQQALLEGHQEAGPGEWPGPQRRDFCSPSPPLQEQGAPH